VKSHALAKVLLTLPDMDVATHAMGHTYQSNWHRTTHGPLKVATMGMATVHKVGKKWVKEELISVVIGDLSGVGEWPFNGGNERLICIVHDGREKGGK
jgi:hypothetical protein